MWAVSAGRRSVAQASLGPGNVWCLHAHSLCSIGCFSGRERSKLHTLRSGQLEALYPNWKDFLAVRRALDPEGRMLNPYLKGLFGV